MGGIDRSRAETLDRTLVLMREHIGAAAPDSRLLSELSRCRVLIVADRANAASRHGQVALVTSALLCARAGADVFISADNVRFVGTHSPVIGAQLNASLVAIGADLIPGSEIALARTGSLPRSDVCVLVGDTPASLAANAEIVVRICGDDWSGSLFPASERGESWVPVKAPFGAMAAAALVAAEAFKVVMRRLRDATRVPHEAFDATFAPSRRATVRLAPVGTPCPSALGGIDFVSGGAITHAALYALSRIEDVTAIARVIEPQTYDLTNLNRYALMRRSDVDQGKADHLTGVNLGGIRIEPRAERYDEALQRNLGGLKDTVLVGVDHIPSRWLAQANSRGWLGVAATERYETVVSFHHAATPCTACLHYSDSGVDPRAPTIAFVSFWAGLWLAALCVRHLAGEQLLASQQVVLTTMLRPDLPYAISKMPVQRRSDCRLSCV